VANSSSGIQAGGGVAAGPAGLLERAGQPRLLLVDDDRELTGMLAEVLADQGYLVDIAHDGHRGLHLALSREYDLLVVDRKMPAVEGTDLVTRLRKAGFAQPILMLTALGATADKVAGLDAGAEDYLIKPFEMTELLARLRALLRRHPDSAASIRLGGGRLDQQTRTAMLSSGRSVALTTAEFGLLWQLASRPGRVYSREELRARLFSEASADSIVDTYVYYLRRKVGRGVIRTVRGLGYRAGEL
jgi:two-component system, OmpR family, response regulator QseB